MPPYDPNYQAPEVLAQVGGKAIVFSPDNQVLVLRRSDKSSRAGGWDFPGGGLDFGEDPITGILREIKEETAITDTVQVLPIHVASFVNKGTEFGVMIGYRVEVTSKEITLSWEHDYYEWMTAEKALGLEWPPIHRSFLEHAIKTLA